MPVVVGCRLRNALVHTDMEAGNPMKHNIALLSLLITVVLLACSVSDISSLLQPTVVVLPTGTPPPPVSTPTPPSSPTYTPTPTLIGLRTEIAPTFPSPFTATTAPTITLTATAGSPSPSPNPAGAALAGTGFDAINVSAPVFHWGACEPTTVTITASVTDPAQIAGLVLFTRVGNKASGAVGSWNKGESMALVGPGAYSRMLNGVHMDVTQDSWIQFQLVGTDADAKIVARSPIYRDALSLSPCP